MSNEADLQSRHYRRGTILGLTLAELLLLLLFLFLLIMAVVIGEKEREFEEYKEQTKATNIEVVSWREIVSEVTEVQLPERTSEPIPPADLDKSIDELRKLKDESTVLRSLGLTDIDQAVETIKLAKENNDAMGEIQKALGGLSPSEVADLLKQLSEKALVVRPGADVADTFEEGLGKLGSGLEACIRLPRQPGEKRGAVAYSFITTLTPEGVIIRTGDEEAFAADWTGPLPLPRLGVAISAAEFNQNTRRYYTVGNSGAPVPNSLARRPCRFYIRIERSTKLVDVSQYEKMIQSIQQNFYRGFEIVLVD